MDDARGGKSRLAEALTRVVAREGISGVSVRAVAAEAGVSGGAVQYHFPTRAEMVLYAMEWTSEQVEQRLSAVPRWGDVREWTREILLELLPLDVDRHRQHAVWLAFIAHAETDPKLADVKRQTNEKLRGMYSRIVRARRELPVTDGTSTASSPTASTGIEMDAPLLQSHVDGLSLQLAALELDEAIRVGPRLLDRYLVLAVDGPEKESEQ
ncbi:MAG TPA: TetR/AcrR family transcriptional regulator [Candidatus Nesterenkonia stercoripullorum]|uniref:TetR/AcrR family transcriptional regulator n=1 Tax=Candidatus Nesterenkonia stercoripullorum TaxID=2838701 RepID=A0A9D1S3M1_9MICC|nr:TetR/AcrR family transcriptional regulator [Candidatus Nesterenkonia stercoripullorum]